MNQVKYCASFDEFLREKAPIFAEKWCQLKKTEKKPRILGSEGEKNRASNSTKRSEKLRSNSSIMNL